MAGIASALFWAARLARAAAAAEADLQALGAAALFRRHLHASHRSQPNAAKKQPRPRDNTPAPTALASRAASLMAPRVLLLAVDNSDSASASRWRALRACWIGCLSLHCPARPRHPRPPLQLCGLWRPRL